MKYAGIKWNDATNCLNGICVSLFTQGCPFHCKGCHNPETWDFNGGYEVPPDIKEQIIRAISANGVQRSLSILGGEPLCNGNSKLVLEILIAVRAAYPNIKIFLWTGYELNNLLNSTDYIITNILDKIDILIDGKFEEDKKDLSLTLRGSSNQNIWEKDKHHIWTKVNDKYDNCIF